LSKKKLIKGTQLKVKGISEQGISRISMHGKVWKIDRVVYKLDSIFFKKGPLIALKSCDERDVYFWFNYSKDSHFKIIKFLSDNEH
jgi:hypothetical protein